MSTTKGEWGEGKIFFYKTLSLKSFELWNSMNVRFPAEIVQQVLSRTTDEGGGWTSVRNRLLGTKAERKEELVTAAIRVTDM